MTLTIPEELLLLHTSLLGNMSVRSLRATYALVNKPLAAARLIELVLVGRLTVESGRKRLLARDDVVVRDATTTGDDLLDEVLERLTATDLHGCTYWIKQFAEGAGAAYEDRLVAKALVRSDISGTADRHVADADAVSSVTARIRMVVAQPATADLRDVSLVELLAQTQSLFGLLHDAESRPAGPVRGLRAQRRSDRLAREALDQYKKSVPLAATSTPEERNSTIAAATAVGRIAAAAGALRGSGPG